MKRIFVLFFLCAFILTSCGEEPDVRSLTEDFVSAYGADGIVYSTECREGEDGYISDDLAERLFGSEVIGMTYSVFLNTHLDYTSECGAFLVDTADKSSIIELCQRRMSLLDPRGEHSFVRIYSNVIFYSTMQDKARAEHFADIIFKN